MLSSKKSNDVLQKRIPKNPKYDYIESTIDTGASLSRYMKRIEEIKQNYRMRNDELFKRMKVTTFVQLVLQVAEINSHLYCIPETLHEDRSIEQQQQDDTVSVVSNTDTITTHRSTFQGVISGVGELDVSKSDTVVDVSKNKGQGDGREPPNIDEMPYLLLDVRDRDEFDQCHIIKSLSYPSAMIARSVNFETKEMLACRNKDGKIIIVYDEDERIAPRVADTLVQRGYDNLFLLSGGLKVAYKKFPNGLITGRVPDVVRHAAAAPGPKGKGSKPQRKTGESPNRLVTQRLVVQDSDNNGDGITGQRLKAEFTMEDLAQLSLALDMALDSQSTVSGSSVYTRQTNKTSGSRQAMSVTSNQVEHSKPFKC